MPTIPTTPPVPSMPGAAEINYKSLSTKYAEFTYPEAEMQLGGSLLKDEKGQLIINDLSIELTCGFEASIARFRVYNVYDADKGEFKFESVSKQILLGVPLVIKLGYNGKLEPVFTGFVASVCFGFDTADLPYIEVTGMDVKGIMMSNNYANQLTAKSYGEAVKEILQKTGYERMKNDGSLSEIEVQDTPDKKQGEDNTASAETVEMVSESDYEFCVKAAKKFNYEFFTDRGKVYFRKAKSNKNTLMELKAGQGLSKFEISYSITGMVESIEARAMDAGSGKVISASGKYEGDMSTKNNAKGLVSKSKKVYIDPSITSQEHADARVASLLETMSYRLGSLECECPGIPELVPGRFVSIAGLGTPVNNIFYVTTVVHDFKSESGFRTKLTGIASAVKK